MRYLALATDYDGTLATHGSVDEETVEALQRLRHSGRLLIMVTGRELPDLFSVFPLADLFDCIVAENGALLYMPEKREKKLLVDPPPPSFAARLRELGVAPLSVGEAIVATREPHERVVFDTIHELGLDLQVIFNKGAVMVLPSGVNKATGLKAALSDLGLSPHNVVAVGDAENDHALLALCECGVAVANALPVLKARADLVTAGTHGAGVRELIDLMISSDLRELEPRLARHDIRIGNSPRGSTVCLHPYGRNLMVAGPSGSGKSTFVTAFLEDLDAHGRQFCIIDPEGDYANFSCAVTVGDNSHPPNLEEAFELLEKPWQNVVLSLLGVSLKDRPRFFHQIFPRLQELRARTGRPHWIVIDEAHHLLPAHWQLASTAIPRALHGLLMITMQPDHIALPALHAVDGIVAVGDAPEHTVQTFAAAIGKEVRMGPHQEVESGTALYWSRADPQTTTPMHPIQPKSEHKRHRRKYVVGSLSEDESFYFQGADGKLNLRAENLGIFMQMASGVDEETWMHHLRQGHYSKWFRCCIKDNDLARFAEGLETTAGISAQASRSQILEAIRQRYTV